MTSPAAAKTGTYDEMSTAPSARVARVMAAWPEGHATTAARLTCWWSTPTPPWRRPVHQRRSLTQSTGPSQTRMQSTQAPASAFRRALSERRCCRPTLKTQTWGSISTDSPQPPMASSTTYTRCVIRPVPTSSPSSAPTAADPAESRGSSRQTALRMRTSDSA